MKTTLSAKLLCVMAAVFMVGQTGTILRAQERLPQEAAQPAGQADGESQNEKEIEQQADEVLQQSQETLDHLKKEVDANPTAQEVSAGILKPIYLLAERISFPAFHWVAFSLMTAGVVGFAFQLVFTKLVLLAKLSFSLREILADGLGLVISLLGLVLTTQAAAENSTFTRSPAAVLSATALGILIGLAHYRWGQALEVDAATGRRKGGRS